MARSIASAPQGFDQRTVHPAPRRAAAFNHHEQVEVKRGAAPQGAKRQSATSHTGADGKPVLSGEVLRSAAFPPAAGGGKPNPGLLPVQFRAGDKPGLYRPTFEFLGGNSYTFTLEAVASH